MEFPPQLIVLYLNILCLTAYNVSLSIKILNISLVNLLLKTAKLIIEWSREVLKKGEISTKLC